MPSNDPTVQPLVLIADDDELMRSLISAALHEVGFATVEVSNGRDAVTLLSRVTPDLVMLDVQMPFLDGFATCLEIRATQHVKDLPIVIVTGTDDTDSIERAFESGATDFISKPVNWSLLGHRMRYVLRGAETHRALLERETENAALLEALPDRLVLVEQNGAILKLLEHDKNRRFDARDHTGEPIDALLPVESAALARGVLRDVLTTQTEGIFDFQVAGAVLSATAISPDAKASGSPSPEYFYEARVVPQSETVALMIIRDVTDNKASEARIHRLAYYDALTELPNRHYFLHVIGEVLQGKEKEIALFSIDLDQFKRINDILGHETGDVVLVEIARRLDGVKHKIRKQGCYADVARLSGDEFVFLAALRNEAHLLEIMRLINAVLNAPIDSTSQQLVVTSSIGVATHPEDGRSIHELLKNATHAMNSAKRAGGNTHALYRDVEQQASSDLLKLEFELRSAIANDGLELFFQPKYRLADGVLHGAEALLRWLHPDRGSISPGVFIPMAERSGLIIDIDRWVIDRACRYLHDWQTAGLDLMPVSINLSGRAFSFDRPAESIAGALKLWGVDPSLLEIEITETVLMADAEQASKTLTALKAMGIRLAIDDFGTGYSSLSYLKRFPLDVLKIDRAFIKDLETDTNDRSLCRAMVSIGHSLDLQVVAEGIETEFQRQFLKDAGCELAQGFLLDKPMCAQDFEARLGQSAHPYAFNPIGGNPALLPRQ